MRMQSYHRSSFFGTFGWRAKNNIGCTICMPYNLADQFRGLLTLLLQWTVKVSQAFIFPA